MKYLDTVINCGLFQYVKKSDYIDVYERLNVTAKTYQRDETIFYEGDLIDSLCVVAKGSVRGEKAYPSGEIHLVSLFDEDAIISLEISVSRRKNSTIDLIANEESTIIFITMRTIEHSRHKDRLHTALIEMLADENIRMMHKIEILAERGLRDRVLVYLNILSRKAGSNQVTIRMSREQLAQYLCVNRSALSNELNKMRREGIIDFHREQFRLLYNPVAETFSEDE